MALKVDQTSWMGKERLPDVVLDDLANHTFQVKKSPESFISKALSPCSCSQVFLLLTQ